MGSGGRAMKKPFCLDPQLNGSCYRRIANEGNEPCGTIVLPKCGLRKEWAVLSGCAKSFAHGHRMERCGAAMLPVSAAAGREVEFEIRRDEDSQEGTRAREYAPK